MNPSTRRQLLTAATLGSLIWSLLVLVLATGISKTPYGTRDALGRTMGFNDRLSPEHYWIIVKHFSFAEFFQPGHAYDWVLLAMQTAAVFLLRSRRFRVRTRFWFFATQPLLFPLALLGALLLPNFLSNLARGTLDREGIIDIPFVCGTAQFIWVLSSLFIASVIWRTQLPLKSELPKAVE